MYHGLLIWIILCFESCNATVVESKNKNIELENEVLFKIRKFFFLIEIFP